MGVNCAGGGVATPRGLAIVAIGAEWHGQEAIGLIRRVVGVRSSGRTADQDSGSAWEVIFQSSWTYIVKSQTARRARRSGREEGNHPGTRTLDCRWRSYRGRRTAWERRAGNSTGFANVHVPPPGNV